MHLRILDRFPQADLANVCRELHEIAKEAPQTVRWIATPNYWLQFGTYGCILYVPDYHDRVAAEAVNDLEDLTSGLSSKIRQKIMMRPAEEKGGADKAGHP